MARMSRLLTVSLTVASVVALKVEIEGPFKQNVLYSRSEREMFAAADFAGSDRASEISYEVTARAAISDTATRTNVVVMMCDNLCDQIGVQDSASDDSLSICCNAPLRDRGLCATEGDVILRASSGARVMASAVATPGSPARLNGTSTVVSTGVKAVAFALCPMDAASTVDADFPGDARVTFRNPYGYLPARMFGYMVVYPVLAGLYSLLFTAFLVAYFLHWQARTGLQPALALMLLWGAVESIVAFSAFAVANDTGAELCCPPSPTVAAWTVLSVGKHAAVFTALLAVSHGFGVTTVSMPGRYRCTIGGLFSAYFAFNAWNDLEALSPHPSRFASSIAALGAVLTTVTTLLLIGFWLNTSVTRLESQGQTAKLAVYRRLRQLLVLFATILFTCTIFAQLVITGTLGVPWQAFFIVDAWFPVAFFVLLTGVALIWWPSASAAQLAVSYQIPSSGFGDEDEDDDEDFGAGDDSEAALRDAGTPSRARRRLRDGDGIRRVDMARVEMPERGAAHAEPSRVARSVFSVGDEDEEEEEEEGARHGGHGRSVGDVDAEGSTDDEDDGDNVRV